jgi:hypothetical protein
MEALESAGGFRSMTPIIRISRNPTRLQRNKGRPDIKSAIAPQRHRETEETTEKKHF